MKIFLAGRNVRNTNFTSSLKLTVFLLAKMHSTEDWMELRKVGLALTWVQPSLPKRLPGARTSATGGGSALEMHRPRCPGHTLSPRAPPLCSAPWVGVLCPEPPKAGTGGQGLSALLKCEIDISFQSDVTEADTPAPMSVFPPENVSCQEIYLLRVHPLRPCSE